MPSGVEHDAVVRRALVETVWLNKAKYEEAESAYQRHLAKENSSVTEGKSSLVDEIARTRQQIKHSLQSCQLAEKGDLKLDHGAGDNLTALQQKLSAVESDNHRLSSVIEKLNKSLVALEKRVEVLEKEKGRTGVSKPAEIKPPTITVEDEDDVDLFGSDEDDDEEREKLHDQRVKAYEEKKSKKTAIIAKSNIILDVKPWDDETDMKKMEESVRAIELDGLVWGAAKLVPLAYGIFKLQISCVVEDDKVSVDDLQEKIEGLEELVQSVDIAAFNKV